MPEASTSHSAETLDKEIERIQAMAAEVDSDRDLSPERQEEILATFEYYECWSPYFRLLKRNLAKSSHNREDYVRLARVQNLYLEDVFAAAETCCRLVEQLKLGYKSFQEEVLPRIVEFEDFTAEAAILSAVSEKFSEQEDLIACLERLCMLYEKKIHNETQLTKTYERLLEGDPRNVKALRYFKLVFTQSNDWEEVVGILKTLLDCVSHPQEHFRVAQELAGVFLYQLDMAEEAIAVLDTHCSDSPLDTSTLRFDAFARLADWNGCLRVLRECLLGVDDDMSRAVLHFKIAGLEEQLGREDEALDNYQKAARLWPQLYDAIEGVIQLAVARKDWTRVKEWLEVLVHQVEDPALSSQLRQAVQRLEDGLAHAEGS